MERLDSNKIKKFLGELNEVELRYLELTVQMATSIQNLIKRHNLSKEQFCELFKLNPKVYMKFTKGNFEYTVHDMAMLNSVHQQLEIERIKESSIVSVAGEGE